LKELRHEVTRLSQLLSLREGELALMKLQRYGRSSERREADGQGHLFDMDSPPPTPTTPDEEEDCPPKAPRKRRPSRATLPGGDFPEDLPRKTVNIDPPEAERVCECCSAPLKRIGEDVVERLGVIPSRFEVTRYVTGKWACPNKDSKVLQKPTPPGLVDRSKYEASIYAMVIALKYGLHLPLYRIESTFKAQGVEINRSTLWTLIQRGSELLKPVIARMKWEILSSNYLQVDDSFVTVVVPKKKGSRRGHLWVIRHGRKVVYEFTLKRNRERLSTLLQDWAGGILQVDGHDCSDEVAAKPDVIRVGCWAHARRGFVKADKTDPAIAKWFLKQMARMFRVERILKERREKDQLTDEEFFALRHEVRNRITRRILDRIESRRVELITSDLPPLPKAPLGRALTYLLSQSESLRNVLHSGQPELDNNASERDLRHAVIGRKNWHVASENGGVQAMADMFSLAVSCKAAGIDFEAYLLDVFLSLSTVRADDVETLTPWAWGEARGIEPAYKL
jgi:transposase